ncbi:DNA glycosylase, partial [Linderina pennispora]
GDTGYISLCKSIVYQQLAGKAAAAILLKFLRRFGTLKALTKEDSELTPDDFEFPRPSVVASLDVDEMRECGLGQRKSEYMKAVAEKFRDGELSDAKLAALSDDEVTKALVAIRGIGPWTADMFLMFHLKRANVLPTLDLAIRKSMCKHFGVPFTKTTPTHDELVALGRIWEPYRSVATWYMWRMSD